MDKMQRDQIIVYNRLGGDTPDLWVGTLHEWAQCNPDLEEEAQQLESLPPGGQMTGGGGAAPLYTVTVLARGKPATDAEASTVAKAKAGEALAQARSQLTAAIKLGCAGLLLGGPDPALEQLVAEAHDALAQLPRRSGEDA